LVGFCHGFSLIWGVPDFGHKSHVFPLMRFIWLVIDAGVRDVCNFQQDPPCFPAEQMTAPPLDIIGNYLLRCHQALFAEKSFIHRRFSRQTKPRSLQEFSLKIFQPCLITGTSH
jgi:hypothetical protein